MRTWMLRRSLLSGIPAAMLAGTVLALVTGTASAAVAPVGDPTGVATTALKVLDVVGHKGLPPLPDTSQIELPAMPIGQQQRALDPRDLPGGGLSLSDVQLNGQDLPKPALPAAIPSLPNLGGQQRSLDPSHIAVSGLPQLPKLPSVGSGLPVSVLPDVSSERALPDVSYAGQVPTGALHSLASLATVTSLLGGQRQRALPNLPSVPGATLSGLRGVPALGDGFVTAPARSIVPGAPSTSGVLGGLLGHAPRLPVNGI